MTKTQTTWESVVKTLKVIGTGTTRYGDLYNIYAWDKSNHAFIEWWYNHSPAERKSAGINAGMTAYGFGIRDLRNTSHAPKVQPTVKGKKTAKAQPAVEPVVDWATLFNKQQAILSSLMDRMAEVETALTALQPAQPTKRTRKTVKK